MVYIAAGRRLDPEPFREWCNERLIPPTQEWGVRAGELAGRVTAEQLARDLGIDERRLYAWRREVQSIERDRLEDALHRAGYALWDVYPDLPETPITGSQTDRERRRSAQAKLSDSQLRALHVLHTKGGLSIRELGRRVWKSAGYASPVSAEICIRRGFRRLYLSVVNRHPTTLPFIRRCEEVKAEGERCESFPLNGEDFCIDHHPETRDEMADRCRRLRAAA